ncbi:Vesicular integral-membrane protein VIP36 [Holothuria leucospilota]|uniref:Vesicular integral-membrane protein VIP36 n=1 Tax=Holothuria leucospilota TaxID=206669 RepID=A0A9Q1CS54_HOLLE|nr:Vesicular integral-membrane protein VIP36 [Holothuria leucospilota]
MAAYMEVILLLAFGVLIGLVVSQDATQRSPRDYLKKEHSLMRPFTGAGASLPMWDIQGNTMVTNTYVRLTPDKQSKRGAIWNKVSNRCPNWELHVQFKVHGQGRTLFGDGFALWYTKDRMKPALAKQVVTLGDGSLPQNILPGTFTTLVWDNIDFGEETLSGKGTTHSTNGIMIQRPLQSHQEIDSSSLPTSKKTKERSIIVPPAEIVPFMGFGKRKGPDQIGCSVDMTVKVSSPSEIKARSLDFAYHVLKFYGTGVPSWTGFNTLVSCLAPRKSVVAYLPAINQSPTDMDTVQTILHRSMKYADALRQDVVVLVFDQAIYAKAQQIRWRDENLKQRLVVRLGMFHTKMSYLACIGKRYRDAGLADIMIESGLIAQGSINGVMNGHHYNRSMRANKIMCDALCYLQWESYMASLNDDQKGRVQEVMAQLHDAYSTDSLMDYLTAPQYIDMVSSFNTYIEKKINESATFAFWSCYIQMVENVLQLTRATRSGNWELHLSAVRKILPWMFAYDRHNYARYLSAYFLEMCDLPRTHPSAFEAFYVECDLCIEQTSNRDAKTKGGMVGFTTNPGAVLRWLLTQHECSSIANQCKLMSGKERSVRTKKELDTSRILRDETDVKAVISTIHNMVNPFEVEGKDIVHISSGVVATEKVKTDLMMAENYGTQQLSSFCSERLQKEGDAFFEPIKRQKLATFEVMKKKTVSKIKGKNIIMKTDRKLFSRLVFIAKVRKLDMKELMQYCLGPLPLPLASEQGTLVKTNKSTLMHHLESSVENCVTIDNIPPGSIWIIDGMAMLQQLHIPSLPVTFSQVAEHLLQKIVKLAVRQCSSEIHFVTDTYPFLSIKNAERGRRASTGVQIIKIQQNSTTQKRPTQWKKFLGASENKEALVEFLFHAWQHCAATVYQNVTLYFAHGSDCHALRAVDNTVQVDPVIELKCTQEEADTRMLLHAAYAQKSLPVCSQEGQTNLPAIVIKSLDTDVLIISLGNAQHINSPFLLHTGRGDTVRTIDLKSLQMQLGIDVCTALVGFHPFTGCDSVSGFFGKGKIKPFKLMVKHERYIKAFKDLGSSFVPSDDVVTSLNHFVCHMYGQDKAKEVNDARYNMFRLGTSAPDKVLELMQCCCKKEHCKLKERASAVSVDSKAVGCSELGLRCTELCTCMRCENFDDGDDAGKIVDEVDSDDE